MGHAAQSPSDYSEGSKTSTSCQLGPNPSRSHRADVPCPVHTEAGSLSPCSPPGLTSAPPPPSALIPATLAVYLPSFDIRGVFAHGQKCLVNLYSSFKTQFKCQMQIVFPEWACGPFRESRCSCSTGSSGLCLPVYPFPQWQ